jgi:hypothetical protein
VVVVIFVVVVAAVTIVVVVVVVVETEPHIVAPLKTREVKMGGVVAEAKSV